MFPSAMSNSTCLSEEASFSSLNPPAHVSTKIKKRSLPGNPDPDAEVIALSPKSLMTTNRFMCEICNKGFQRDQNLQLHRRGHNLPWKLKQRNMKKRAYICPEASCVHHHPSRALGDLTGIKKHFCRKHGEKKWKCEKCSKMYAVQSDWKAHSKTCGTREYRCDCGTLFSRKDSFITHRAFCDALAEESARQTANQILLSNNNTLLHFPTTPPATQICPWDSLKQNPNPNPIPQIKPETDHLHPSLFFPTQQPHHKAFNFVSSPFQNQNLHVPHLSATALLQKAASVGSTPAQAPQSVGHMADFAPVVVGQFSPDYVGFTSSNLATWHNTDRLTRDFLGLTGDGIGAPAAGRNSRANVSINVRDMLTFTGGVEFQAFQRDHSFLKNHHHDQGFGFAGHASGAWSGH